MSTATLPKSRTRRRGGARGSAKGRVAVTDGLELERTLHRQRVAEHKYIIKRTPFPPSQDGALSDARIRLINGLIQQE